MSVPGGRTAVRPMGVAAMTEKDKSRPWWAGRIKDARGRPVTQLDPVTMHLLERRDVVPPDVLQRIAEEIGVNITWAPRILYWVSVFGLVALCVVSAYVVPSFVRGRIGWISLACNTVGFAVMWLASLAICLATRRACSQRVTRVMLKHRRCPHCGYDLRLLPVDPKDAVTVCPECGSAWKLVDQAETGRSGTA